MKKLTVLAIVFLLLPAFSAGAASTTHRKHMAPKARASEPAPTPTPPVTRLPIAPDTFRA
jgi:curli biogenesis system outer membrane secretion channel CsgG